MINPAVLNLMVEQGGAFNRKLVELYRVADSENSQRLEQAFSDLFERFAVLLESQEDEEDNYTEESDRIIEDLLCSFDDNF